PIGRSYLDMAILLDRIVRLVCNQPDRHWRVIVGLGHDSLNEVPDSLAPAYGRGSASGMTGRYELASSSCRTASASSGNRVAASSSSSCARLVALAMGAVMLGRAISQARATLAGVDPVRAATSSRAARMRKPRGLSIAPAPPPRGLLPRSALLRYLPVKKPLA